MPEHVAILVVNPMSRSMPSWEVSFSSKKGLDISQGMLADTYDCMTKADLKAKKQFWEVDEAIAWGKEIQNG